MSKDDARKIIGILSDANVRQVTCSGGEPLMYPHLKYFIKEARDNGMVVHMNTNGYFMTSQTASDLSRLGLSQVQINVDSMTPVKHDLIRGKEGSFGKAIQALKNARDAGIVCVSQTVLTKDNENEIMDIFKFVRGMGVQRCRVWDITPEGHASGNMDIRPSNYMETLNRLARYACDTGAKNIESGDPLFFQSETGMKVHVGFCAAAAGLFMTVSPIGDVYFCAALRDKLYNIFDVGERGLEHFHKEKLADYTGKTCLPIQCMGCENAAKCKGGCPSRRKFNQQKGDYLCKPSVPGVCYAQNFPIN